jgi:hypothetical protein
VQFAVDGMHDRRSRDDTRDCHSRRDQQAQNELADPTFQKETHALRLAYKASAELAAA